MFRAIAILCALASASAFTPSSPISTRSALKMSTMEPVAMEEAAAVEESEPVPPPPPVFDPKGEAGVTAPFGFFDPLSLCPETEREFIKYREAELKHGRVAMLAFAGFFVGEVGGFLFGNDITGPAIFQYQQAESLFNAWSFNVLGLAAAVEGYNIVNGWDTPSETFSSGDGVAYLKPGYVNGDLKFDPLGFKPKDAAKLKEMQTKEINNGRLAMIAMAGLVVQELISNSKIF